MTKAGFWFGTCLLLSVICLIGCSDSSPLPQAVSDGNADGSASSIQDVDSGSSAAVSKEASAVPTEGSTPELVAATDAVEPKALPATEIDVAQPASSSAAAVLSPGLTGRRDRAEFLVQPSRNVSKFVVRRCEFLVGSDSDAHHSGFNLAQNPQD